MREFQIVLLLLLAVAALVALSRRVNIPYPILLVLGGLALGFLPGLPTVYLQPQVVLFVFLPPLFYGDAWNTPWRDFRANLRPISLLAIGLVLTTTAAVAAVAHTVVPGLPWAAAFVLGAVVAPTDAVAAGEISRRLHLPQRIVTIISGESLVNDASALVLFNVTTAAAVSGTFSLGAGAVQFVISSVGGVAIGLIVAWVLGHVLSRFDDPPVENTLGLLAPFGAYLPAEAAHTSGVLAVVAAGLYLGRLSPRIMSAQTRVQATGFWAMLTFLLNGLLFILVGLQLHTLIQHLGHGSLADPLRDAFWVCATVILGRIAWVFPATYLPRWASRRLRESDPSPPWKMPALISWAGMRGGISLAAALAIPLTVGGGRPFPNRDLLVFLTYTVILATLVLQGLSLPWVIRRLNIPEDETARREEAQARQTAAEAAMKRLDELAGEPWVSESLAAFERKFYATEARLYGAEDGAEPDAVGVARADAYTRLKGELLAAEREAIIRLRDEGDISDAALSVVQRDLDLEALRVAGENTTS